MDELAKIEGPVPLAEEHLHAVAGGALSIALLPIRTTFPSQPAGCLACTSGGPIDVLAKLGEVVSY